MIIVKLQGGLGNQLFQYALGRMMSLILDTNLKLDTRFYSDRVANRALRNYSLSYFQIVENLLSKDDVRKLLISRYLPFFCKSTSFDLIKERTFGFDRDILKKTGNLYLEGFFQSSKYFKGIEPILKEELSLKESFLPNGEIVDLIKSCDSVSVHIRRGDYARNIETNNFHGLCSLEYYNNSISEISKLVPSPIFFIFSDDLIWAKEKLKTNYPLYFVEKQQDYQDLFLMSLCRHNIIANSSFSWWGAWLNDNPERIVFAPKKWFNNTDIITSDLLPNEWMKM